MADARSYRLLRRLASGGMAEVWIAEPRDEASSPRVAIKKMLPAKQASRAMRNMFLDEARIASRIDHPNVVRVVDYGLAEGSEFIAFELVDGTDGRRALEIAAEIDEVMPEPVALHVVSEIARALEHAHGLCDEHGAPLSIVHRDVTPSNVLLSWAGDVLLSDFGIAFAARRQERTATGRVKGKEGYIAPEQAMAKPVTAAADVYGLGATLHALLFRRPPLVSWHEVTRRFTGAPLELSPLLAPEVARLVAACMELEPERRPTAGELAREAAALAARDAHPDPRSMLVRWLEPVRDAVDRRGSLDDLMNPLALVSTSETREITLER